VADFCRQLGAGSVQVQAI